MNGNSTQPQAKAVRLNAAEFEQQWQEAKRCDNRPKPCPQPQPNPIVCERDSEEINIYFNTEQSNSGWSGVMAWLPWLLLGLTSLLLLGNMFMMFAAAQSTNNTAREVNNTINRSREVVRVERSNRDVERPYYPPALW